MILDDPELKPGVGIRMAGREVEKLLSIFAAPKLIRLAGLNKVHFRPSAALII